MKTLTTLLKATLPAIGVIKKIDKSVYYCSLGYLSMTCIRTINDTKKVKILTKRSMGLCLNLEDLSTLPINVHTVGKNTVRNAGTRRQTTYPLKFITGYYQIASFQTLTTVSIQNDKLKRRTKTNQDRVPKLSR